jgi:hypothetical protein
MGGEIREKKVIPALPNRAIPPGPESFHTWFLRCFRLPSDLSTQPIGHTNKRKVQEITGEGDSVWAIAGHPRNEEKQFYRKSTDQSPRESQEVWNNLGAVAL